jgi:alpha-beta hydrolase superfamily lysophospholipase
MRRGALAAVGALSLLCAGCAALGRAAKDPMGGRRAELAFEAGPLSSEQASPAGPAIREYLERADRLEPGYSFPGRRRMGVVDAGARKIGAILLLPPEGRALRGTVLAFHGYLSYSLYNLSALYRVAEAGWAVIAADLPGHGFSDGVPGAIADFSDYADAAAGVLRWAEAEGPSGVGALPRPFVLLGHSAGGAAVVETLWDYPGEADAAILLAPLVRPRNFGWAAFCAYALGPFVRDVHPFGAEENYLGVARLPLSWIRALSRWLGDFPGRPKIAVPTLVLQGAKDDFLAWKYNLKALRKAIPGAGFEMIPEGGHVLLNRKASQDECLDKILDFLEKTVR